MMPSPGAADRKIRCVVIQLGSLTSTLQSIAALKSAKEQYPGLEFQIIASESSAEALRRISWIDQVLALPAQALVESVASGNLREKHALGGLARWAAPLVQFRWDFLVNWTYSASSSYLAALIPARVKLGYTRRKDRTLSAPDGWSRYFQAIIQGGLPQNIHLTDILSTQLLTALQIHFGAPATTSRSLGVFSAELGADSKSLADIAHSEWVARDRSRKWVALQLEGAESKPGWGVENWGKLAAQILRRHPTHSLVLLGRESESRHALQLLSEIRREGQDPERVMNLVGKTDFNLWSTILGSVSWLLTGSGPAAQVASLTGTRVLSLVAGNYRLDSGPYGNGHYVITPLPECAACADATEARHECRSAIHPDTAYGVWSYGSSEWSHLRKVSLEAHFSRLGTSRHLESVNVHRSRVRSIDEGGGVDYENLVARPTALKDWNAMVLEHLARELYCGWTPEIPAQLSRVRIGTDLLRSMREISETSSALSKIAAEAGRTSARLSEKSSGLRSENVMSIDERMELHALSSDLHKLEDLIKRLSTKQPIIAALARLHAVMMHNLSGVQLAELSSEASLWYAQLGEAADRVQTWAARSLQLARPVALATAASAHPTKGTLPVDSVE